MTWAIEGAANPSVLRVHVRNELTTATILTCPPGIAPAPLDALSGLDGVRSIDLHRYRVRVNLIPGGGRAGIRRAVAGVLEPAWGAAVALPSETPPRAFAYPYEGPRLVAESLEMARAATVPALEAVLRVEGVVEAVAAPGLLLVRIGRLFVWDEVAPAVAAGLAQ